MAIWQGGLVVKLEDAYTTVMSIVSLYGKSNDQALELIAHLTDISSVFNKIDGAQHTIKLSAELPARDLTAWSLLDIIQGSQKGYLHLLSGFFFCDIKIALDVTWEIIMALLGLAVLSALVKKSMLSTLWW